MTDSQASAPKIVIVGAGFAGLSAVLVLEKQLKSAGYKPDITLIDQNEYFEYTPGLHLSITDDRELQSIQFSLKKTYGKYFVQDTVTGYGVKNVIGLSGIEYPYDYLIVATGSRQNYFHNKSFKQFAYAFKTVADIKRLKPELEKARSVAVIGGGYTGIEIASILVTTTDKQIYLVHSREQLMAHMHPGVGKRAAKYLRKHGVDLVLNERVTHCGPDFIELDSGKKIMTDLALISSGVIPNSDQIASNLVITNEFKIVGREEIYVCGDAAPNDNMATAHSAMIEGRRVAHQLLHDWQPEEFPVHTSRDGMGSLSAVALGKHDGIVTFGRRGIYLPRLVGLLKKFVEKRVLFEFKRKMLLPL